jgi:hypothetical protein
MTFFTFGPLISGPDGPANGRVPAGRDHQLYRHPLQGGGEQGDLTLLYLFHVLYLTITGTALADPDTGTGIEFAE